MTASKQVSSRKLAAELLELWHHLMRGSSQQMYALIAELDVSITQRTVCAWGSAAVGAGAACAVMARDGSVRPTFPQ